MKTIHRFSDMIHGMEIDFTTGSRRDITFCKATSEGTGGIIDRCPEEATHYDPHLLSTAADLKPYFCRYHHIKAKRDNMSSWVSYPEHATVTISKENEMSTKISTGSINIPPIDTTGTNKTSFTLDELLSPAALNLLNTQSFVCFKTQDGTLGWFSRKTKTTIEEERLVVSASYSGY